LINFPLSTILSLKTHDVLSGLGVLFIIGAPNKATELQCTGCYRYRLVAARDLVSGQSVDLELSMYWNCGWREVSKGQGSYDGAVT
jgi:hypothetical protein